MLSATNIQKKYGQLQVLKGVDISINKGEILSIVGSSGAGKSTLLHILGTLDNADAGQIILNNERVDKLTGKKLAAFRNHQIGFVFQSYNLLARTSAIENVELPLLYNSTISAKERKEKAMKALASVKLADRTDHLPNQLSGGQQQRVAIARALVNEPVMILADEATGNLDTRTSYEIMALLQELNTNGKTIVFVTHEPDIATFSSRTITLKDGRVVRDTKNENVRSAKEALAGLPMNDDY